MLTNRRLFLSLVAVALAPLFINQAAFAQRSIVFQHGLLSAGSTWDSEALSLSSAFEISPFVPTTTWSALYATQASQLASAVTSAGSDAILIGHSNGGLVGRVANMPAPYANRSWGGLVTIATPHLGAPLATAVLDGDVANTLNSIVGEVFDAINFYQFYPDDGGYVAEAINALSDLQGLMGDALSGLVSLGISASVPVSNEMIPGSATLNLVNAQSNLTREAAAIPVRIGINSALTSTTGLIWKGLFGTSHWEADRNRQLALSAMLLAAGAYYEFLTDAPPDETLNAYRFLDPGLEIYSLDDTWCGWIGAQPGGPGTTCNPSDGIVPVALQLYPGALPISITGPAHVDEVGSPELDASLKQILANNFHIQPAPPPPPEYWAEIEGTTTMAPGDVCLWHAATNVQDPDYEWLVNGQMVGFSQDLSYRASSDFTLELEVSNAGLGQGAGTSIDISVSSSNSSCLAELPINKKGGKKVRPPK